MAPQSEPQMLPNLKNSATQLFSPVQQELDRIFDQLGSAWASLADVGPTPRLDMIESKDGVELTIELPGMTKADVKIAVEGGMLTVSGEKRTEKDSKGRHGRIRERSFGAFERSITLPHHVDLSMIKATMADGVLTVVAPKLAGSEPRTIKIQSPA